MKFYVLNYCFCSTIKPIPVPVKEDDFPTLVQSGLKALGPMAPVYTTQAKRTSSFQEEDFPVLVSKIRPQKPQGNTKSAWSQAGSSSVVLNNKPVVLPTKVALAPSATIFSAGDPPLSGNVSQSRRKKKLTNLESTKAVPKLKSPSSSDDDDPQVGKMPQEIRAVPTMLEISSLLTVKGASSQPNAKSGKKKKQLSTNSSGTLVNNVELLNTGAHKENVPETKRTDGNVAKCPVVPKSSSCLNGYKEKPLETKNTSEEPPAPKKQPIPQPSLAHEEEDFPALISKKPPPGMTSYYLETNISSILLNI